MLKCHMIKYLILHKNFYHSFEFWPRIINKIMSTFPYIFRKHPSEHGVNTSQDMSKSYLRKSNSSTRRSSLTSNCSRASNASSLWSSSSSGISSLDVSLITGTFKRNIYVKRCFEQLLVSYNPLIHHLGLRKKKL